MSKKIIKGFVDKAGNRVEVEGAGTDYNEGKNSVAIGNGTTAVGEDQFVFGRRNAPAANKAEVVGGGAVYQLGDIIVPANPDRDEDAMIYAGHSLTEFRTFLQQFYGVTPEDVVIADEHRTISGTNMQGQTVYIEVPNVDDYDDVAFVVFENEIRGDEDYRMYIYGIDAAAGIVFQPFSELQGHFYFRIEGTTKQFTSQGLAYFQDGAATLRGAVGNPGLGERWFNHNGNFYKTIMALREKNIRTLDWEGNETINGDLEVGGDIVAGGEVNAGGDVTCTDGQGGTISLRALAAAVAELIDVDSSGQES